MKVKTLDETDQKAVAKMIENSYVMEDDKEVKLQYQASEYSPEENIIETTGFVADLQDLPVIEDRPPHGPAVVQNPETKAEMAVPYGTPYKEVKLHKTPLKQLTAELEQIQKSHTVRNGGMRGVPKSVRNRIDRLERVIGIKTEVYKRAMEQSNELSSISKDT